MTVDPKTLKYAFTLTTLAFGVAFTFFTGSGSVQASVLYSLTLLHLGPAVASAWGIAALVVAVGAAVGMWIRKKWLGEPVTALGFLLWLYALILYIISGFWLQVFAAALPNMLFWAWYYLQVRGVHKDG